MNSLQRNGGEILKSNTTEKDNSSQKKGEGAET